MTLLRTQSLSRSFDGLHAVRSVDLTLEAGEIRAVIGPNGAGKTTLVSMICGRLPVTSGKILFKDRDITAVPPWQRVLGGIVYTFQITSIFGQLSCHDNVALSVQRRMMKSLADHLWLDRTSFADRVNQVLDRVGLRDRANTPAGILPYGHQRLLEVAMGLALEPQLLILDEPTQGLSDQEIVGFCSLIRELAQETTILIIEHNMPVVMELAHRITVMSNGAILAEGDPASIRNNADVRQAYLGT